MKLRKGQSRYKLPRYSEIHGVTLGEARKCEIEYRLVAVIDASMDGTVLRGRPIKYSLEGDVIVFGPTPDQPYTVTVLYAPPLQQF